MKPQGTILIVDDNPSILSTVKMLLSTVFKTILTHDNPKQLISTIRQHKVDVVLLDMNFNAGINTGNEGLYWLREIKKIYPSQCEVVLFTAYADIDLAIRGMKLGAADFIVKPWDNEQLVETLVAVFDSLKAQSGTSIKKASADHSPMFWSTNSEMLVLKHLVEKVAPTDANILITGENGTGKDVLAREIHRLSLRTKQEMVTLDMGAVSETLFESELFGHKKGAFTDAKADRVGKFEQANGSTLFMDEIGNLPLALQAKMLSAIQTRQITRVGSNTPIPIDVRLVSATNCDLQAMTANGEFRTDLMFRLNTIVLELPPLRKRPEDILPLAQLFLEKYNAKYKKQVEGISPEAQQKLTTYEWPGNVRELQHAIEKAIIICSSSELTAADFAFVSSVSSPYQVRTSSQSNLTGTLEDMEQAMIQEAIRKHDSNLSLVAASLGISRQTLYNKMKKYNI